jgi:glycosyltransferase involved in cell wall biosynthesis
VPAKSIELVLVGELTEGDKALVERSAVRGMVKMPGYRTHEESVAWVKSADALFLPLHTPLDGGPALVVPGKTYEYLGSGRPVLAMGPPGDMRRYIQDARAGFAIAGDDVAGAEGALEKLYEAKIRRKKLVEPVMSVIGQFERRELSRQLAEELRETVRRAAGAGRAAAEAARPSEQAEAMLASARD